MRANQVRILGYSLISRYLRAFEQLDFCRSKPS
jgi:hypothetical protein